MKFISSTRFDSLFLGLSYEIVHVDLEELPSEF